MKNSFLSTCLVAALAITGGVAATGDPGVVGTSLNVAKDPGVVGTSLNVARDPGVVGTSLSRAKDPGVVGT